MIPEQKFAELMDLDLSELPGRYNNPLQCCPQQLQRFDALLQRIMTRQSLAGASANAPMIKSQFELILMTAVAEVLTSPLESETTTSTSRRYAAYRKAIDTINHSTGALGLAELAAVAGVSQRVLQLAFKDYMGTSPYAYLLCACY